MHTFLLLLASVVGQTEPTYRYTPVTPQGPGVGLWAWRPSGAPIPVASDPFAFRDLVKYTAAQDHTGLKEMVESRRLFFLKCGTAVKTLQLDRGDVLTITPAYEVRILDGSHEGKSGWVPASNLWNREEIAVKAKRGVTKTDPGKPGANATTLLKMARNMEKANMGAARKYYQEILTRFPDSPEAAQARERLRVLDAPGP